MISILLAVCNGEKYISQSVGSIIDQTFKEWELLIGLNGTTDSSREIINSFQDKRIKLIDYGDDKGKAKTLNKLIKKAKYDWCAIQDDDDIWLPDKLKLQSIHMEDFDVIGTFIKYIDKDGNIKGGPTLSVKHEDINRQCINGTNEIANSSAIFKTELANEVSGWNEELDLMAGRGYQPCEDFDFWIKLLKKGAFFYNIPNHLVLHRIHSESNFNTKRRDSKKIPQC